MDKDTHNRTDWCDFPSLCSSAPCCYRKQRLIFLFFFHSVLSFPIRMSFTSSYRQSDSRGISPATQTVTSWSLPSRIRVSGLPGASFLLKSVSFFTRRRIVYSFSSRSLFLSRRQKTLVSRRTYVERSLEDGGQKTSVRLRKQIQVGKRSVSRRQ